MKHNARRILVGLVSAALFAAWLLGPVRYRVAYGGGLFGYALVRH